MADKTLKIPVKKTIVFALISGLILFILFKTLVNVHDFSRAISSINLFYFYLAFGTMVPSLFLSASRWYFVIRSAGFNVSFKKILGIILSTLSFSVIPGRLGDFARSYPLRNKIPLAQSTGTIILEKIMDLIVLIIFSATGLVFLGHTYGAALLVIMAIAGMLILPRLNFITKRVSLPSTLSQVKNKKASFSLAVLSSGVNWTMSMLQAYWLFMAVGGNVPLVAIYAFLPLSIFAGLIPFTIAGVGTRDSALIYFFGNLATYGQSLVVGIMYSAQTYFAMSLIGIPLLYYFFKHEE